MMNKAELLKAGDDLAVKILDPRLRNYDDIKGVFNELRDNIKVAQDTVIKPINDEANAAAHTALAELKDLYLNLDQDRASAYIRTALGGEAADLATAARVMGDDMDMTYVQERILEKMEVLWYETDMADSIAGWKLNNRKIWQEAAKAKNPAEIAQLASSAKKQAAAFRTAKAVQAEQNRSFWASLKEMNKSNPEFVTPLVRAYELTDGEVNSIHKLNNYMKEVLGVTNKAFVDGNPKIPSQVVQGMWATFYNLKLSSLLTPVKAISNNFSIAVDEANERCTWCYYAS